MKKFNIFKLAAFLFLGASILFLPLQVNAQGCNIYVVENPKYDNSFNDSAVEEIEQNYAVTPVRVTNLTNLANNVSQKMNNEGCSCIRSLIIVGHGMSGQFSVGCGTRQFDGKGKCTKNEYIGSDNKQEWQTAFQSIKSLLCEQTLQSEGIFLFGCSVGTCTYGAQLLYDIAKFTGANVFAPTENVDGDKIDEYLIKDLQKDEWQTGSPTDSNPRPCKYGKDVYGPVQQKTAGTKYSCPCNNKQYSGIQECTNSCTVTLSCYTNICDKVYTNNTWNKYGSNPILTAGTSSATSTMGEEAIVNWDQSGVSQPNIIKDGSTYAMWFMGWDASDIWRIGYATSTYGFNWTKYSGNPVLDVGSSGSWDAGSVYKPSVIKEGNTYKMWYQGYSSMSRIGYATSTDGINWTKHPNNPVLDLGSSGAWDYHGVGEPTVIKDGTLYKMWYAGYDGWWWRIGYATSTDGINWTKYSNNPVLSEGAVGSWEEGHVGTPSVIKDGSTYHMLYGSKDSSDISRIGYATSSDGIQWTKSPNNPELNPGLGNQQWDNGDVAHPTFFKDNNEGVFKVFYRGMSEDTGSGSSYGIGYATATALTQATTGGCDFNGDGKTDILWRNKSTGQNVVWLMNGTALSSYSWIDTVADTNWQIVGTGDFNGDGKTDILWRNKSTGQNIVWLMNGATQSSYSWIDTVADTNWQIVGTGDFNGDGKTDILWRNKSTGQNVVWLMNGIALSSYSWIDTVADTNWEIVGTGDFNGDGKTDILWRNKSTGQDVVWLMNGATLSSYSWIDTVADTNWQIVGTGDFNGDGKTDILWRNKSTGQNVVWLMNGTALSSYSWIDTVADTNWEIVGPK